MKRLAVILAVIPIITLHAQKIVQDNELKLHDGIYYLTSSNIVFTGKTTTHYPNGEVESCKEVKKGIKTGKTEIFYDSGKKLALLYEDENHINYGKITCWNEDGTISLQGKFKNGKLYRKGHKNPYTGIVTSKYEEGSMYEKACFKEGLWHGNHIRWDRNGEIIFECIFDMNKIMDCPIYNVRKK